MDYQISQQAAIKIIENYCENGCDIAEDNWCPSCQREQFIKLLEALPPAQPKVYTKADYIMALHKEYGCTITRAQEAHNKALEYLRSKAIVKG